MTMCTSADWTLLTGHLSAKWPARYDILTWPFSSEYSQWNTTGI